MANKMRQSHQLFLQTIMSHGILNATEVFRIQKNAKVMYGEETNEGEQRKEIIDFVGVINTNIKAFGMEVKKGIDESDGSGYYCLVNTTESSITRCASQYTENELEFLKKLIEMIMTSNTGVVGSIAAVNTVTDSMSKKMSKVDAEYLLENLHESRWIDKKEFDTSAADDFESIWANPRKNSINTNKGKLYLSTRSILELDQYILDMYPDAATRCNMCKKLAVQGETCEDCGIKLHKHCAEKYFKDRVENKCPECRTPWASDRSTDEPATSGTQSQKRKGTAEENNEEIVYQRSRSRKR